MATPEEQAAKMFENLEAQTGQPLDGWLKILKKSGLTKHGEIVKLLKSDHGVTHGYANLIAHAFKEDREGKTDQGDLVSAQYAGKDALRPIYDRIIEAVSGFGSDVEIAPKKGYVSLRRKTQFALVQPSTKTRLDLGIKLRDWKHAGRLEASGSFNAMVSHRVRLETVKDVDAEVVGWLREAYREA
jgi:predicted transport protein